MEKCIEYKQTWTRVIFAAKLLHTGKSDSFGTLGDTDNKLPRY